MAGEMVKGEGHEAQVWVCLLLSVGVRHHRQRVATVAALLGFHKKEPDFWQEVTLGNVPMINICLKARNNKRKVYFFFNFHYLK